MATIRIKDLAQEIPAQVLDTDSFPIDSAADGTRRVEIADLKSLFFSPNLVDPVVDEVSTTISPTINKAAGAYTALLIDVTETAAPGDDDDRLLSAQVGGVEQAYISTNGGVYGGGSNSSYIEGNLAFAFAGIRDAGMGWNSAANEMALVVSGQKRFEIRSNAVESNETFIFPVGTEAFPGMRPADGVLTSGFWSPGPEIVAVSAGGVESQRWDGDQALFQVGSVANPGIAFDAYPGIGLRAISANGLGFYVAGAERFRVQTNQIWANGGTEAQPSYAFINSGGGQQSGMYRADTTQLGWSVFGVNAMKLRQVADDIAADETFAEFNFVANKASGTNNYTALQVNVTETAAPGADNLLQDWQVGGVSQASITSTGRIITEDTTGVPGTPALELGAGSGYGVYKVGGSVAIAIASAARFSVAASGVTAFADGTVTTPTYNFGGRTGHGMWTPSATETALSANGVEGLRINDDGQLLCQNGTTLLPSMAFASNAGKNGFMYVNTTRIDAVINAAPIHTFSSAYFAVIPNGTAAAPAVRCGNVAIGLFRSGSALGLSGGSSASLVVDGANKSLTPDGNDTWDLGTSSFRYAQLNLGNGSVTNGALTFGDGANENASFYSSTGKLSLEIGNKASASYVFSDGPTLSIAFAKIFAVSADVSGVTGTALYHLVDLEINSDKDGKIIAFSNGSTEQFAVNYSTTDGAGIQVGDGGNGAGRLSYGFINDTDLGIYRAASGVMGTKGIIRPASDGADSIGDASIKYGGVFTDKLEVDNGIALGGGSAPTLGTIGGSGPATAEQDSWLEISIAGVTKFIPIWD